MNTAAVVGIVALVVITGVIWYVTDRKRRTETVQARDGPEYTRTASEVGSRRRAEKEVVKRQERVEHLEDRERAAPIRASDRSVERVIERDIAHAAEDVPITDEHAGAVDNPRRDGANPG